MARTESKMIELGSTAPLFSLPDTISGSILGLPAIKGEKATLVAFICNHCPFVKHVNPELVRLAAEYEGKGVSIIAISSNDAKAYPADGPQQMKDTAFSLGYPFPYLYDETQEVAKAFGATCTPDFFLYNGSLRLSYRGQLDDSRPGNDT
jgi:thiol-disulfide isomerase/thioredoxin